MDAINAVSRGQYHREVQAIIDGLNRNIPADQPKLFIPDEKFNRAIGDYAGKTFSVTGEPIDAEKYEAYKKEVLPSKEDEQFIINLEKDKGWIIDPEQTQRPR
jgi:hypothetical protein